MTEQEVELIYNYLHENYRYEDGKLIRIADSLKSSQKKGDILGSFFYQTKGRPFMTTSISIDGIKKRFRLDKLIYFFHYKKIPKRIDYVDKNPMNLKIDNLINTDQSSIQHTVRKNHKIKSYKTINKDGTYGYFVQTKYNNKVMRLGTYRSEEEATKVYQRAKFLILDKKLSHDEIIDIIKNEHPESSLHIQSNCGFKGVSIRGNKFTATPRINGKRVYLGMFNTPEEAHTAYLKAKEEYVK